MSDPHDSFELEQSAEATETGIRQTSQTVFSQNGIQRVHDYVHEFIRDLTRESVRIAKLHKSDSVSAAYVNQAREHQNLEARKDGSGFWVDLAVLFWELVWLRLAQ